MTIVFPEKFDFLDRNNSPTHRSTMTDSTEQFAEIMNKTIQEAAEADARVERLEYLLKAEREERALELDQKEQQIGNLQYELEQEQEEHDEYEEQLESLLDHRDALREENKELKAREKWIMDYEHAGILGCDSYERFCQAMCELEYDEKCISELKLEIKELNKNM